MAKQQKMDDEDSLKRRARRRLIGAVALITVVVVVLPMVLDREPKPMDQNIELRIPDKNTVGEFNPKMEPVPARAPDVASSVSVAADTPAVEPVAGALPVAPQSLVAQPENKSKSATSAQTQGESASAKPAASSAPDKSPAKPQAAAKAADKPVDEAQHPAAKSGFVVQVGAFSNAQTAHDVQKKLSQKGIKAYIEKAGSVMRVRVGPFKTREEADQVKSRLEAQGFKSIVAPLT